MYHPMATRLDRTPEKCLFWNQSYMGWCAGAEIGILHCCDCNFYMKDGLSYRTELSPEESLERRILKNVMYQRLVSKARMHAKYIYGPRKNLGAVASRLATAARVIDEFFDDPITEECGCAGELFTGVVAPTVRYKIFEQIADNEYSILSLEEELVRMTNKRTAKALLDVLEEVE